MEDGGGEVRKGVQAGHALGSDETNRRYAAGEIGCTNYSGVPTPLRVC